jgi:hypothetical protein
MDLIQYTNPLPIQYDKLSNSFPVSLFLYSVILYFLDNWFYTFPISSLLSYYQYSVVYLSILITDPLSFDCTKYIASDTASDYSVSYLVYKLL